MSRRMKRCIGAVAVLLAACSLAPAAPGEKGSIEFGPYVGWTFLDDYGVLKPKNAYLPGLRFGVFATQNLSFEASFQDLSTETSRNTGLRDFQTRSIRLNGLWNFRPEKVFRPFLTLGAGYDSLAIDGFQDQNDYGGNAGGGLRWILGEKTALRVDGRYVYHKIDKDFLDDNQSNVELTVGLSVMLGGGAPKDTDGDGVRDGRDKCPNTPSGAMVDEKGCPKDADGDGVWDGLDACPDTPKGWPVDERGCPTDKDGDGVSDGQDKCPDTPKGAKVNADGCPTDADGDGVWDGIDTCPDTPKGWKVDARGCPLDSDGDGVVDGNDKCPDTPRGTTVDAEGCPVKAPAPAAPPVFPEGKKELILEGVTFATNRWELTPEGMAVLDPVAASLKEWPDVRIELQGHTDSTGADAHNMQLSQKRAESVRAYLISKGVPESQIVAKGYGETKPIADNKTKEGRAKNRRTEMVKIE